MNDSNLLISKYKLSSISLFLNKYLEKFNFTLNIIIQKNYKILLIFLIQISINVVYANETSESLQQKFFNPNIIQEFPKESLKSIQVHFKDSFTNFPNPNLIKYSELNDFSNSKTIQGKMTYVSIIKKKYQYHIKEIRPKAYQIQVFIHFKNATDVDQKNFAIRLKEASIMWT